MEKKFDLNDIVLVPAIISNIISRSEIKTYDKNGKLPIFIAPMDTVVDINNYELLNNLGLNVCIPRQNPSDERLVYNDECFISYGLDELDDIINKNEKLPKKVLIDVANGHSIRVYELAKKIKEKYDIILMVGNIANPKTIVEYDKIGVDYIRCSIGSGNVCITASNTAVYYPMGSLIRESYELKKHNNLNIKIIADGGFRNYGDIIRAIGLGADGVMVGSIVNKSIDACGDNYINNEHGYIKVSEKEARNIFNSNGDIYKMYRGMSTKAVQRKWGKEQLKTSEGISRYNKVEYSMSGWIENLNDYFKSSLSYLGFNNIEDFKGNAEYVFITQNAFNRFFK